MPNIKKQEYYRKNRERRLDYQRNYYRLKREKMQFDAELLSEFEPEQFRERREKVQKYNRGYYQKNKERIQARRRAKREGQKSGEGEISL